MKVFILQNILKILYLHQDKRLISYLIETATSRGCKHLIPALRGRGKKMDSLGTSQKKDFNLDILQ
jgi:hypothetical protein